MCRSVNKPHHIHGQLNCFTSYSLLQELKVPGFRATNAVRENRVKRCLEEDSKELCKPNRGSFDYMCDGEILAVKWNNNKCVCIATNYNAIQLAATASRYSQKKRKMVNIAQLKVIQKYKHMGGVDLVGLFISDYCPCNLCKKWYWPLLSKLLPTLRVAAWSLYIELGSEPKLGQLQFIPSPAVFFGQELYKNTDF